MADDIFRRHDRYRRPVSGAMENMIALCALLNPSLPDESV
jgi:hypothetical protein